MPFKDPVKRRKFHRETMRYRRALAVEEPFALAAERARKRARDAMSPFYALSKHVSPTEYRRVHAECTAAKEQATREYREWRATVTTGAQEQPVGDARQETLREIRRLRAALEQATAKLRAMDESV